MAKAQSDVLRIGMVGAGFVGEYHAQDISKLDGQELVAIAEPVEGLRNQCAARFSVRRAYAGWEDLVADQRVDVVYICTPNDLHLPIAAAAMEAGKDVVCEKPLARNLADARAMVEKARQTGRKLFVTFNRRFEPGFQQAKQAIEAGMIGRPFLALTTFIGNEFARMSDPNSWKGTKEKSGGGVLIDNGSHMIDLLRWYLGDAAAVTAWGGRLVTAAQNKEEDTATAVIEFESGAVGEFCFTFGARYSVWPRNYVGAAIRTEIYGLEGSIRACNDSPAFLMAQSDGSHTALEQSDISTGMPRSLHAHFADCIRGKAKPIVTAQDGLAVAEICEAAYRSMAQGRRVTIAEVRAGQ